MFLQRHPKPEGTSHIAICDGECGRDAKFKLIQEILTFSKQAFHGFGILPTVLAGMSEPHSFAFATKERRLKCH